MCPKTSGISRTPGNKQIAPHILERILSEVVPHIARIDLVGDGEIFLNKGALEKVLFAADRCNVLVNASTNGILMDETTAEQIVVGGLHDLNISMDASTETTFRHVRKADWNLLLQNIRSLNEIKKRHHSLTPHLHFSMVGMKNNIQEFPDLIQLADTLRVESVTLQAMGEFERVKNESVHLRDKTLGRTLLEKARQQGARLNIAVNLWPEDQFTERDRTSAGDAPSRQLKDCQFPWDVPYFATDGSVRPCCAMPPMGNLADNSFSEIWFGPAYQDLRKMMLTEKPHQECVICPGRGWYAPTLTTDHIQPGKQDRQFGHGWYELEENPQGHFRWARESASLFMQMNNPDLLEITLESGFDPGTTQAVTVTVNRLIEFNLGFTFGEKKTVYLPLEPTQKKLHQIQISGNPWRPVETVPGERDPRKLTIKFYGARLIAAKHPVKFQGQINLRNFEIPETGRQDDTILPISLFWECLKLPDELIRVFCHAFKDVGNMTKISLPFQELTRRAGKGKQAFQIDADLLLESGVQGISRQDLEIPIPENCGPGKYQLLVGLYSQSGKRLPVMDSAYPTYRQGVLLGKLVLM